MNYEILITEPFERKAKRLAKKYKSLPSDLTPLIELLSINPLIGAPIGKECFKIRLAIKSKGGGKSGGARIITMVRISRGIVYLLDIYDKSEQSNISTKELALLVALYSSE